MKIWEMDLSAEGKIYKDDDELLWEVSCGDLVGLDAEDHSKYIGVSAGGYYTALELQTKEFHEVKKGISNEN